MERRQFCRQGRGVGEIEDPGAAGTHRDHQPNRMLDDALGNLAHGPRRLIEPQPRIAVAFDETLDGDEQIGPDGLRARIAAPHAPRHAGRQKQPDRRHDQQPGDEEQLLRPDLDKEEIETPRREIDQHRLVRQVGTAVPADPRREIIDRQGHPHDPPFQLAERAARPARMYLHPLLVERAAGFAVDRLDVMNFDVVKRGIVGHR